MGWKRRVENVLKERFIFWKNNPFNKIFFIHFSALTKCSHSLRKNYTLLYNNTSTIELSRARRNKVNATVTGSQPPRLVPHAYISIDRRRSGSSRRNGSLGTSLCTHAHTHTYTLVQKCTHMHTHVQQPQLFNLSV